MSYISIPTVVEAVQWTGDNAVEVDSFICGIDPENQFNLNFTFEDELEVWNFLEDQWIKVPFGHWVIIGSRSELYPCSDDVFQARYKEYVA